MSQQALQGLSVVDVSGSIATSYCAKLYADYGARVLNVEPQAGFGTRRLAPYMPDQIESAMHAYLHTNKLSLRRDHMDPGQLARLIESADLLLDDGTSDEATCGGVRASISWYGESGPYSEFVGSNAQCFALNGMLKNIGRVEGPPLIPTGYQAEIVGGLTAFTGSLAQVLAGEIGNRSTPVHLTTSIFESTLCFTDVGVIGYYNSGLSAQRMGINRYPPTYPLGVFPCADGWIGLTVLTPSQWRSFCRLLDMPDFADVEMFQSSVGRLEAIDVLEPVIRERLLNQSAEELFYRGQTNAIPLARVPTMEELFGVDQFVARNAFTKAQLPSGESLTVPSVPFRLYETPPKFGGVVAALGEHTKEVSSEIL
ncbi:MAG: CaiB/BaiF CoA-transferase family protein [Proteobacteria bacterium]|nr:CaiB/BaiF CoA-transferase family protein [Pseudomonadota bacterium]